MAVPVESVETVERVERVERVDREIAADPREVPEPAPKRRLVLVHPPAPDDPHAAGRNLVRRMVVATVLAVPVVMVLYLVLVAVALRSSDWPAGGPLTMAAGLGVYAALFWGFWFGIAASIREIEETEEHDRARIREMLNVHLPANEGSAPAPDGRSVPQSARRERPGESESWSERS